MKRQRSHLVFPLAVMLMLLSACKPTVPSQYLQPDEMEDLMYDFYLSQGMTNNRVGSTDYEHRYYLESVLKKYGLTSAEFDSSMVYYYNHMEKMNVIYTNIQKRLSEEALELGTSAGEVERFTIQSASGDTTDVWEGRRQIMLLPIPPYHVAQFSQKADTSFHKGDSFLLTFGSTFLVQSGSRNATVYLAVTYENDSVVSATTTINNTGNTTLRLAPCDQKAKKIDGYMYMARREHSDNESELCLLMLSHIQLMRFHHSKDEDQKENKEEVKPDVVPVKADTIDSLKPKVHRLGERPMPIKREVTPPHQIPSTMKPKKQVKPTITRQ